MDLMAGVDDEQLCEDGDLDKPGQRVRAGDACHFLALAEDWLIAQDALQAHEDDRDEEICRLRRQWDQGTLEVDAEAVADKLLGVPSPPDQQNRPNRSAT